MKIKVVGAAGGEVTGSAYLVETSTAKVMIDAGMFDGTPPPWAGILEILSNLEHELNQGIQ